ncbi:CHAT domain-containing protein [Streptomyces sp. RK9]|uniref:CHAT domain-containing protein n=1 Tax=Streptomyces sp. RK9 TaxID=3239284 RepID=UPI003865D7E4
MSPDDAAAPASPAAIDELYAQRDELRGILAAPGPDGPGAPELHARIGFVSYQAFRAGERPDDLRRADEAFEVAFGGAAPVRTPPSDPVHFGLWRAAYAQVALFQYLADPRRPVLEEALRRYDEAVRCADLDTDVRAELSADQGALYAERSMRHGGGPADAATAAAHYGAALETAPAGSDLPHLRCSRGIALMESAWQTQDRAGLTAAREELERALHEAGQRPGAAPEWAREAAIRAAFIRVIIWSNFQDQAQSVAAETDVLALLADPETEKAMNPVQLDGFGRVLYERATLRGDGEVRDRGIGLIRRAVGEWQEERHGRIAAPAFFLAMFQQSRFWDDRDPERVHDVARAARLLVADPLDDELGNRAREAGKVWAGWARFMCAELGVDPGPDAGPEGPAGDELGLREVILGFMNSLAAGRTYIDHSRSVEGFPGMSAGRTGMEEVPDRFDRGFAAWSRTESEESRARTALELLQYFAVLDPHAPYPTARQKYALIDCVLAFRPDDPEWQRRAHAVVGNVRLRDAMAGADDAIDEVIDHFVRAGTHPGGAADEEQRHLVNLGRMQALGQRGRSAGTADDREEARAAWAELRDSPHIAEHTRRLVGAQHSAVDAQEAVDRGDLRAADRHIGEVAQVYRGLADDDPVRAEIGTLIENALMARDALAAALGAPAAPRPVARRSADRLRVEARRLTRDRRAWVLGDQGLIRFARATDPWDEAAAREAMELLGEAYDLAPEGADDQLRYGAGLGVCHCTHAEQQRDPAARTEGVARGLDLLERTLRGCGGPEHRLYASTGLALGRAYRTRGDARRGDREAGRRTGLDALRGHAWAALLQSGTGHAAQAAAQATDAALEVAGWCLRDNAPQEAVQALDACRGLVLHAATTSSTVPERLVAAGHGELAREWRESGADAALDPAAAAPTVPSSLRRRVLAALTGSDGAQDRLLDPPTTAEIAAALRTQGKDALVYLVPASDDVGGTAVVVTSRADVHAVPLPRLTEDAAPLRAYRPDAVAARDLGPVPGAAPDHRPPPLRAQLDRLCGWAWYAGVKPLFDTLATATGRGPRLVLVPMGTLGLVPWHAAWTEGPEGRRRYALAEAEISYAASARLLCEVAARPAAPHTGAALVVGDPTGDLRYAGEEADAVQRVFYPRGQFLGRRAGGEGTGPGTPREVVSWLTRDGGDDGAVLHLACHAAVTPSARRSSHLSLHGGELSAEELTEAVGAGRRGRLGLVLLAACRSHVSGHGHNEAYSLATAFLVAGARSVVGSLWPVPDDATSVLMFMAHHYLRAEGEPPARALRRAQLWMVDPHRVLPPTLPASLAFRARRIDPDDLSAWAGFTHLGQ